MLPLLLPHAAAMHKRVALGAFIGASWLLLPLLHH
jgi:hypothetical protein